MLLPHGQYLAAAFADHERFARRHEATDATVDHDPTNWEQLVG